MNDALKHPKLIDKATDCGYFWKVCAKIYSALSIIEQQTSILKVATDCKNQDRKTDDKQSFVNSFLYLHLMVLNRKNKCKQTNKEFIFAKIYKIPLIQQVQYN